MAISEAGELRRMTVRHNKHLVGFKVGCESRGRQLGSCAMRAGSSTYLRVTPPAADFTGQAHLAGASLSQHHHPIIITTIPIRYRWTSALSGCVLITTSSSHHHHHHTNMVPVQARGRRRGTRHVGRLPQAEPSQALLETQWAGQGPGENETSSSVVSSTCILAPGQGSHSLDQPEHVH